MSPQVLAGGLFLLMISPVLWGGYKMAINALYYRRYHKASDLIMSDPDKIRRAVRLMRLGGPKAPY